MQPLDILDARIPMWNHDFLTPRHCPFCDTKGESLLKRPDQLPVAFCATCGCWYVNNLPSTSDLLNLYEGYYDTHRPTDLSEKGVIQIFEHARKASETNWHLHTLLKLNTGNGRMRILDVGCGFGRFLLEAKSMGAGVVGCDLSPEACEYANKKLGITVHQSELHLCSSSIGKVDAIVMRDFIEHPIEPLINIKAAIGILNPSGLLLFHTPNGGEAGTNVETARKWVGFRVDLEHLQYLSPHTVNWLSLKYNLRIERLETSGFPNLNGIDKLPPKRKHQTAIYAKEIVKKIPMISGMLNKFRALKTEMVGGNRDLRLGSYHLFAMLRKV
jgi:2-polyprenyl-3-methyl-5-hydroxy-6-metoxy-1,4-benzoquinol methylase